VNDRQYWLAWSQISGVGPILLKRLQQQFGQLAIAWEADCDTLRTVDGIGEKLSQSIVTQRAKIAPDELFASYTDANPWLITPADPEYPQYLWEIADPPPLLHYRGNLGLLQSVADRQAIALVGTRDITDYGKRWTQRLSASLSGLGWTIVSGMAAGVDTEAHQSCLAAGGRTIAVLGTGVDLVYPSTNRSLYQRIGETGLLLSEYADGTPADRRHFPARNRIVAGLSRATIVLEAGLTSGALITARLAHDHGREVYALAGSLDNPQAAGGLKLISEGAKIIISESSLLTSLGTINHLNQLDLFATSSTSSASTSSASTSSASTSSAALPDPTLTSARTNAPPIALPTPLPANLQALWQVIATSCEPIVLDAIVDRTGLPTGDVLGGLLELELMGIVQQDAGMRYLRS
jgi:DNA processing protein